MGFFQTIIDFIVHFKVYLEGFITTYGLLTYAILFVIIFCETGLVFTPILPGDSLIFAAGTIAALKGGGLNILILLPVLMLASIGGDNTNYRIGRLFRSKVLNKKKIRFVKQEYIDRTQGFFDKYGVKTIVIAKFLPIIRTFSPFVAGVGHMPFKKFFPFNMIGGIAWVSLFLGLGYFFGNLPFVQDNFELVIVGIILVSLLPTLYHLVKGGIQSMKAKKKAQTDKENEEENKDTEEM